MRKRGDAIAVGDVITVGGRSHRVTTIEPYTHPTVGPMAGIARCEDGWAITLDDTVSLEVV
jgi:hypothetical protein